MADYTPKLANGNHNEIQLYFSLDGSIPLQWDKLEATIKQFEFSTT